MQVPWLERRNFESPVGDRLRDVVVRHRDGGAGHFGDHTLTLGDEQLARVVGGRAPPTPCRCRAPRDAASARLLALHVGAHQRAVRVVVLEERDQRRRDGHHLLRRDVHVVDLTPGRRTRPSPRPARTSTLSSVNLPFASMTAFAWAMMWRSSSSAAR